MNLHLNKKALTLIELLIAISLLSVIVLGFSSIDSFARYQVMSSDRRAKLQNELSFALEHMSKNIMRGIGDVSSPPLESITNGFRVNVDRNNPPTPGNLGDDTWIRYTLSGNTLRCSLDNEILSTHIVSGVVTGIMPSNPANGFYINLTDNSIVIEIGLVARWQPAVASSIDNPQITMRSQIQTRSSSAR